MKMESAGAAKGHGMAVASQTNLKPKEGTKLRARYDLFMANKGVPIDRPLSGKRNPRLIHDLRDYYGLDIRCLGYRRWVLAGEWFGPVYIDYIADKIK
jgi:hypothetical protein